MSGGWSDEYRVVSLGLSMISERGLLWVGLGFRIRDDDWRIMEFVGLGL